MKIRAGADVCAAELAVVPVRGPPVSLALPDGGPFGGGAFAVDLGLASVVGVAPPQLSVLQALEALALARLGSAFALIGAALSLVGFALALVGDAVTFLGDAVTPVRHPVARVRLPLTLDELPLAPVELGLTAPVV
jgi:hypothetical protein